MRVMKGGIELIRIFIMGAVKKCTGNIQNIDRFSWSIANIEPHSAFYRRRTLVLYNDYRPANRSITYTYSTLSRAVQFYRDLCFRYSIP